MGGLTLTEKYVIMVESVLFLLFLPNKKMYFVDEYLLRYMYNTLEPRSSIGISVLKIREGGR